MRIGISNFWADMTAGRTIRAILCALVASFVCGFTTLPAIAGDDKTGTERPAASELPGGTIVDTKQLVALIKQADPVMVDVAPVQRKPEGNGAAPWLPPTHHSIVKSVWIPSAGLDTFPAATADFFRDKLAQLSKRDQQKQIVFYCHPDCPLSLNAAKRAISQGYRRVYWYPDGIETWQEAGLPTAVTRPEGPMPE